MNHNKPAEPSSELEGELRSLMMRSLDGDRGAYVEFMERVAKMVRARLQRSARRSKEQIEDLVQDVLLAVHNKRGTYRTDLPILPWLHTITRYKLIDLIRQQGRQPALCELNDELDQFTSEDCADTLAQKNDVEVLLSALPERQREILRLAKIEEMPLKEISELFDMSLANVKVTIHRTLELLRKNNSFKREGEND